MLPYEGIKKRTVVENHPESCRIRPHSKALGGCSAGTGTMVMRSLGKRRQVGKVPLSTQKRPVLLPMGPAIGNISLSGVESAQQPGSPVKITTGCISPSPEYSFNSTVPAGGQIPIPASPFRSPTSSRLSPISQPQSPPSRQRINSVGLDELAPPSPTPEAIKQKLKRFEPCTGSSSSGPITPRFNCSRNVNCHQGSGSQTCEFFCLNPDENGEDVDQALSYHIQTQSDELFVCPPTVDSKGTLYFTPSNTRSGIANCAVMVTDHAAIAPEKTPPFKCSSWVGFTITVQASAQIRMKNRDWRTFQSKVSAPVGKVPAGLKQPTNITTPEKGSPRAEVCESPDQISVVPEFPKINLHTLRLQSEHKANRDRSLLVARELHLVKIMSYVNEISELISIHESLSPLSTVLKEYESIKNEATVYTDMLSPSEILHTDIPVTPFPKEGRLSELLFALSVCSLFDKIESSSSSSNIIFYVDKYLYIMERQLGCAQVPSTDPLWEECLLAKANTSLLPNFISGLTQCAVILKHAGCFPESIAHLRKAMMCVNLCTEGDTVTVLKELQLQLLETLLLTGDLQSAKEIHAELESSELMSSDDDFLLLGGVLLSQLNNLRGSQLLYAKCLDIRKKRDGKESNSVVEALLCRSRSCDVHGRSEQCINAAQEAIDLLDQKGPTGIPGRVLEVIVIRNLATAMVNKGKYSSALPLFERSEELATKLMDEQKTKPQKVLSATCNLAIVSLAAFHCSQKRFDIANSVINIAMDRLSSTLGDNHWISCCSEVVHSVILSEVYSVDCKQAILHLEHANVGIQNLHESHPITGLLLESIGDATLPTSPADALVSYSIAHESVIHYRFGSEKDMRQRRIIGQLCEVYGTISDPPPMSLINEVEFVLKQKQQQFGEWNCQACPYLQFLAEMLYATGRYAESMALLAKMLRISDNQNLLFLLGHLFKPAAQLSEQQVKERNRLAAEKINASSTPTFAAILLQLAVVQEVQGLWLESEASYLQARAAFEIASKPGHPGVCSSLNGIGRVLYNCGMYGDALSYFEKAREVAQEGKTPHRENLLHATNSIHIVNKKLQSLKYLLERYEVPGSDITFPVYI